MKRAEPSETRAQLLHHGRQLVRRGGLRGLTVRGVCGAAGVNPGSFVYHFGSRERFLVELLEQTYAPLFARIQADFVRQQAPIDRLRAMLIDLAQFVVETGPVLSQFVMDAFAGERAAAGFLRGLGVRHPQLLLRCVAEAQQAGELEQADPAHQLLFLMSSIGMPAIVRGMIRGRAVLPDLIQLAFARFASDPAAIEQRLEWALRGLRPKES